MPEETGADAESRRGTRRRAHHSPPRFLSSTTQPCAKTVDVRQSFPTDLFADLRSEKRARRSGCRLCARLSIPARGGVSISSPRSLSPLVWAFYRGVGDPAPPAFARNLSQQPSSRGLGPKKPTVFFVSSFFCIAHPSRRGWCNMQASRARREPFARLRAFEERFFRCLFHWFFVQG